MAGHLVLLNTHAPSGKGLHPQGLAKGGRIIKRKGGGQIGKPKGWGAARYGNR